MQIIAFIITIITGAFIPFLLKLLDFKLNIRSRLHDQAKATLLYYEQKAKGASEFERARLVQAMVGHPRASEALVEYLIELHQQKKSYADLEDEVNTLCTAGMVLKFNPNQSESLKLQFTDRFRTKLRRRLYKCLFGFLTLVLLFLFVLPVTYAGAVVTAIMNGIAWIKFPYDIRIQTFWVILYSLEWMIIMGIFLIVAYRLATIIGEAEKLLKSLQEKSRNLNKLTQ